jgi:hypothetical protein
MRRRLAELGDLATTGLASGQVHFEVNPLDIVERVERVRGRELVEVFEISVSVLVAHDGAPIRRRNLVNPSLILVFAVPSGISRRVATSRYVSPP